MEKYTQFRDKATGISPYMPHVRTSVPLALVPFKSALVVVRLVMSLPIVLLAVVIPVYSVRRSFVRVVMFLIGLTGYELSAQGVKRAKEAERFRPVKNEVYFVNFTGVLDYFMCWIMATDDFVVLIPDANGELKGFRTWGFVQRALSGDDITGGEQVEFSKLTNKVVYVFAEGTTSNGKAVLPFLITEKQWNNFYSQLCQDKKTHKVKTLTLKLYPSHLTTPLSLGVMDFAYRLLGELQFSYKVRVNFAEDETLLKVKNAFAYNGKFKLVEGVGLKEKREFVKVYRGRK